VSLLPNRFTSRVRFLTSSVVVLLVGMTMLFYFASQRYQVLFQQSELAHDVMLAYQDVSNLVLGKLNRMSAAVSSGSVDDQSVYFTDAIELRQTLSRIERLTRAEAALSGAGEPLPGVERFGEIERIAEEIIAASIRMRSALEAGRRSEAADEVARMRTDAVAGRLTVLIDSAVDAERTLAEQADAVASRLGRRIRIGLSIAILTVLGLGIVATRLISRSLNHAVDTLRTTALEYASGNFDFRTDDLYDAEFAELGDAFDRLGEQLGRRRDTERRSKAELESLVAERTQGLRETNEQLAQSDRVRRQLLADISHELRTPLTVIHGEAEMALRGQTKTSEEYKDSLNRIREQAMHTNRLVDDLLFVSRVEEGQTRLQTRSVAITGLLKGICSDFAIEAGKKQVRVIESYDDDFVVVSGDHDRLRQVFTILIDNALRYTEAGGSIWVSLERQDEGVEIRVRDNGMGISKEDAKQVFTRFYRGANAMSSTQGTGLGLPVAKAIVEAHRGRIYIDGEIGEGAVAVVWLPAEDSIRAIA
jgi:signal transduction histidine kinase